ncbi:MAG: Wzz/FepE/Etk N-terminal domain-containing protein [Bacteroidota bacterium]
MTQKIPKDELSLKEILDRISDNWKFLLKSWKTILIIGLLGGALGLGVSFLIKPKYKAFLTFILDEESQGGGGGGLASLASSIGLGAMPSEGGLFNTPNMLEFLKTRSLIEKTLLKPVKSNTYSKKTYAELFLESKGWRENLDEKADLKKIKFMPGEDRKSFTVQKDSVLGKIYESMVEDHLSISQPNDENSILEIRVITRNEHFSKYFPESLIEVVSEYYIATKIKKAKKNVDILQLQVDSVRRELYTALVGVASTNDDVFGLNPAMNIKRVPTAKKQVDVQANSAILAELVKNLEISKMNLLNQTPLIEVIDKPIFPLEIEKLGKAKGIAFGGLIGGFLAVIFLLIRRTIKKVKTAKAEN